MSDCLSFSRFWKISRERTSKSRSRKSSLASLGHTGSLATISNDAARTRSREVLMTWHVLLTVVSAFVLTACNDDGSTTAGAPSGGSSASASGGTSTTTAEQGGTVSSNGGTTSGGATATIQGGDSGNAATQSSSFSDGLTGAPCQSDANCKSVSGVKNTCKLDWTGGYCTISCASFAECTRSGDLCSPVSTGSAETICVRACDIGSTCRPGYQCVGRSCFPSP